jgi:hypothetical protein
MSPAEDAVKATQNEMAPSVISGVSDGGTAEKPVRERLAILHQRDDVHHQPARRARETVPALSVRHGTAANAAKASWAANDSWHRRQAGAV